MGFKFVAKEDCVVYIYLAEKYEGELELQTSEEEQVYWISEQDFLNKELALGMEAVAKLIRDGRSFDGFCVGFMLQ